MSDVLLDLRLSLGDIITAILGCVGLASIYFAGSQLRQSKRAQQTQILLSLQERFRSIPDFSEFLYRLDYGGPRAWTFDPATFPHSMEERVLDAILYELSFVGSLVAAKDIKASDLSWLKSWVSVVLRNRNVQNYLEWIKRPDQLPDHDAFVGAVSLYRAVIGPDDAFERLRRYLK